MRRGVIVGLALLAVVAGLVWGVRGVMSLTSEPTDDRPRLAVLPFENLGPPEDDYFADGITDEITTRLGKVSALAIRARRSALRYKDRTETPQQLGRDLGVDFFLEATISWERNGTSSRVRVRPQLIKTSDASQVWAAVYDEDMTEVFGVQSAIAERVVSALGLALLESERIAIADRLTENSRAYQRYLRGNDYLAQRTRESVPRAIREYESAVDLDSSFTRALARIGYAYAVILEIGWELRGLPKDTLLARGFAAVDRALGVNPRTPDAWMARAYLLTFQHPRTFEGVADAFERGIALDSTNAEAFHQYGSQMDQLGDYTTAIANLRAALAIDPERPITLLELADISFYSRRYVEAVRWADSALAVEPTFYHAYEHRAQILSHFSMHAEARASVDSASALTEGRLGRAISSLVAARSGDTASARTQVEELTGLQLTGNRLNREDRFWVMGAQVALGDTERTLDGLERDPLRGVSLWFRLQSPEFDPIRSHPRFERLVEASRPLRK
jgi:TolB-like protein